MDLVTPEIEQTYQRVGEREWLINKNGRQLRFRIGLARNGYVVERKDTCSQRWVPIYLTKDNKEARDAVVKYASTPELVPDGRAGDVLMTGRPRPDVFRLIDWLIIQKQAGLSPTEGMVVRESCSGLSEQEIADRIGIKQGTVKTHFKVIYRRLGVRNRTGLLLRCLEVALGKVARNEQRKQEERMA